MEVTVVTYNLLYIRYFENEAWWKCTWVRLKNLMNKGCIVCMQNIGRTFQAKLYWVCEDMNYTCIFSFHHCTDGEGTAILYPNKWTLTDCHIFDGYSIWRSTSWYQHVHRLARPKCNAIIATLSQFKSDSTQHTIRVASVHIPDTNLRHSKNIETYVSLLSCLPLENLVICGNFNGLIDSRPYLLFPKEYHLTDVHKVGKCDSNILVSHDVTVNKWNTRTFINDDAYPHRHCVILTTLTFQ